MAMSGRIFAFFLLVSASHINLSSCVASMVNETCLSTGSHRQCYTLYGSQESSVTWNETSDECESRRSRLAMITSSAIQFKLEELIQNIQSSNKEVHVWTSGILSTDTNWYQVNNESVSQDVIGKFQDEVKGGQCGYVKDPASNTPLSQRSCYDSFDYVLCQSSAPCDMNEFSYDNVCYYLYHGKDLHWNKARQYCRMKPGRDLAYSHITESSFLSQLNSTRYIWIGLSSRTWIWDKGNSEERMVYTKFRGGNSDGKCVYIDPNDGGQWDIDPCSDGNKYFICEHTREDTPSTATTSSSTTTSTTTTSTTTTASTDATTTSTGNNGHTTEFRIIDERDMEIALKCECRCTLSWALVGVFAVGMVIMITVNVLLYLQLRRLRTATRTTSEHYLNTTRHEQIENFSDQGRTADIQNDAQHSYQDLRHEGRSAYENHMMTGPYESIRQQ